MATFPLSILSPKGTVYKGEAVSLLLTTTAGQIEILAGHTNLIATISPAGVMRVITEEKTHFYAVFGGVLDVSKLEGTFVYCEEINPGEEIDMARALAARDRNLDRLNTKPEGIDLKRAQIKLNKALVRISVKQLSEGGR